MNILFKELRSTLFDLKKKQQSLLENIVVIVIHTYTCI